MPASKKVHCDGHDKLSDKVAEIAISAANANTKLDQLMITISRIEERVYQDHGKISMNSGKVAATMKVIGIAAAASAAMTALVRIIAG